MGWGWGGGGKNYTKTRTRRGQFIRHPSSKNNISNPERLEKFNRLSPRTKKKIAREKNENNSGLVISEKKISFFRR